MVIFPVAKIRAVIKDMADDSFVEFVMDENGELALVEVDPADLQGGCSSCNACPNPCDQKTE